MLDALDLLLGEAADGAGRGIHEGTVDKDGFLAVCYVVEEIHSAGSGVDELEVGGGGEFSPAGNLFEAAEQDSADAFITHEGIAEADDNDGFWVSHFSRGIIHRGGGEGNKNGE